MGSYVRLPTILMQPKGTWMVENFQFLVKNLISCFLLFHLGQSLSYLKMCWFKKKPKLSFSKTLFLESKLDEKQKFDLYNWKFPQLSFFPLSKMSTRTPSYFTSFESSGSFLLISFLSKVLHVAWTKIFTFSFSLWNNTKAHVPCFVAFWLDS